MDGLMERRTLCLRRPRTATASSRSVGVIVADEAEAAVEMESSGVVGAAGADSGEVMVSSAVVGVEDSEADVAAKAESSVAEAGVVVEGARDL